MRTVGLILMLAGLSPVAFTAFGVVRAYRSLSDASLDLSSTEPAETILRERAGLTLEWLMMTAPLILLGGVLYIVGSVRKRRWGRPR
ncbi:MAG: hypothetical protein BroJett012_31610 [Betaproteobacteria bacterium]|nr:MAG: hypothetical protein BroJett012_31610 [Betaproteobacteria bacterium]